MWTGILQVASLVWGMLHQRRRLPRLNTPLAHLEGVGPGEVLAVDQARQVAHPQLARPVVRQHSGSRGSPTAAAAANWDVARHADPCRAACARMLLAWAPTWRITHVGRTVPGAAMQAHTGACGSTAEDCLLSDSCGRRRRYRRHTCGQVRGFTTRVQHLQAAGRRVSRAPGPSAVAAAAGRPARRCQEPGRPGRRPCPCRPRVQEADALLQTVIDGPFSPSSAALLLTRSLPTRPTH
jgi:hypothetical protein